MNGSLLLYGGRLKLTKLVYWRTMVMINNERSNNTKCISIARSACIGASIVHRLLSAVQASATICRTAINSPTQRKTKVAPPVLSKYTVPGTWYLVVMVKNNTRSAVPLLFYCLMNERENNKSEKHTISKQKQHLGLRRLQTSTSIIQKHSPCLSQNVISFLSFPSFVGPLLAKNTGTASPRMLDGWSATVSRLRFEQFPVSLWCMRSRSDRRNAYFGHSDTNKLR